MSDPSSVQSQYRSEAGHSAGRHAAGEVGLVVADPTLTPYREAIRMRLHRFQEAMRSFEPGSGLTGEISQGYRHFGFTRGESHGQPGLWYREWAPGALSLRLIGDFNAWNRDAHPMARDSYGIWHLFLPDSLYGGRLAHGERVKVHVVGADGSARDRIPAYARRVFAHPKTHDYVAQIWLPETTGEAYEFRNPSPKIAAGEGLRIYETHVGMAQEEQKIGSFEEFRTQVLPRVVRLGYNAVQLMAVQEHPYYASFGYHVSSFFAVSSRFGTPEELKELIDDAHRLGLVVLLDLVHSHAVKNINEGLNRFDGTDHQYFHGGGRGEHPAWDSLLFDYAKYEVRRFLLSNVRWWIEEFRFDGFRFDGVTSMLYLDHGLGEPFASYDDYFPPRTDEDAALYLQLANELAHTIYPGAITIAEDVSGMPGIARAVHEGGVGFDYRLAMGVPDYWIKLVQDVRDEDWSVHEIFTTLLNRRWSEKHIGYSESHDQALVGDKTLAFRLMDAAMYWHMGKEDADLVVDRGIALLKLIRLITFALAGEGYLEFMGNEFGHPEWIDFPREGNNFSFALARRQWSLAADESLRYIDLERFTIAMLSLDRQYRLLEDKLVEKLMADETEHVLVFRRGSLVFAMNFHPTESFAHFRIPVPDASDYRCILDSDIVEFGGHGRTASPDRYPWLAEPCYGRDQSLLVYLPSRTALVLAPV